MATVTQFASRHPAREEKKYRTEIPNMIDDLNLSPHAFRLYVHFKRVAGEKGKCWQSTQTLSEKCNMSTGQISKAKKELLERKLITIETNELPNGWRKGHAVRVVDVWPTNLYYYTEYRKAKKNMSEAS